jgi:hypothetical protein
MLEKREVDRGAFGDSRHGNTVISSFAYPLTAMPEDACSLVVYRDAFKKSAAVAGQLHDFGQSSDRIEDFFTAYSVARSTCHVLLWWLGRSPQGYPGN